VGSSSKAPEAVKQGIYMDFSVAGSTTGYFRVGKKDDSFLIEIQLKKGIAPARQHETRFAKAIAQCVCAPFKLAVYSYQTFPHSMELDYERKFRNI
jgi:hypothetical protein